MLMTACSDDFGFADSLSGDGKKTPIDVAALLDVSNAAMTTRAADKVFEDNDELVAYLRHVTWDGTTKTSAAITSIQSDNAPKLVTFKKVEGEMQAYSGADITPIGQTSSLGLNSTTTNETENLKIIDGSNTLDAIYWDDFSEGAIGEEKHLRTEGHYLQSYYGFCYNGGEPAVTLTENNGVVGWTTQKDQTAPDAFQHSDLLWSAEQEPIRYDHSTAKEGVNHGKLILPYTHAMSKVTINITLDGSFAKDLMLTDTKVELKDMFTTCTATAPTMTLTEHGNADAIKMKQTKADEPKKATYSAIVVPSVLTVGHTFATIAGVGNDTYTVPVTDAMIAETNWGSQLTETDEYISSGTAQAKTRGSIDMGKGYQMKSGVHYVLNVTIGKAGIKVIALIKDWVDVNAEGVGQINFNADVRVLDKFNNITKDGAQFDLWSLIATDKNADAANRTYGDKATTITYDNDDDDDETEDTWVCDPKIYWQDFTTSYYFRALGKYVDGNYKSVDGSLTAEQGTDLVWGTTAEHKGYESSGEEHSYKAGDAINPRTGNVPLAFEHAMSKITVNLVTNEGSAINLTGAKLALLYNYDKATISLEDGSLSNLGYKNSNHYSVQNLLAANAEGEGQKMKEYIVVPQDLKKYFDGVKWEERKSAITYYNPDELEEVDGKTYDRATLTPVYYTTEETIEHNCKLEGAKKVGDVKKAAVLYEFSDYSACSAYNYKPYASCYLPITESDYANIQASQRTMPAVLYTKDEIDDAKAIVGADGYVSGSNYDAEITAAKNAGDVKTAAYVISYSQYAQQKYHLPLTESTFNALTNASKTKTPAEYYKTDNEANAYNEKLEGALKVTDIKEYKTNATSKIATIDTPKDNSGPDNLIKLIITLDDGNSSTYSLDMSQCIDDNTQTKVTKWEPGKHYIYTIRLNTEAVTFRVLIEDWVKQYGSGDATLDW